MAIASFEVAFEVGTPDLVGSSNNGSKFARMANEATATRSLDQIVPRENITDGSARGPLAFDRATRKQLQQFLGTPGGMMTAGSENGCDLLRRSLMRTMVGPARAIGETWSTLFEIAVDPFVTGFTADVVVIAEFSNRERVTQIVGDKLSLQVHG